MFPILSDFAKLSQSINTLIDNISAESEPCVHWFTEVTDFIGEAWTFTGFMDVQEKQPHDATDFDVNSKEFPKLLNLIKKNTFQQDVDAPLDCHTRGEPKSLPSRKDSIGEKCVKRKSESQMKTSAKKLKNDVHLFDPITNNTKTTVAVDFVTPDTTAVGSKSANVALIIESGCVSLTKPGKESKKHSKNSAVDGGDTTEKKTNSLSNKENSKSVTKTNTKRKCQKQVKPMDSSKTVNTEDIKSKKNYVENIKSSSTKSEKKLMNVVSDQVPIDSSTKTPHWISSSQAPKNTKSVEPLKSSIKNPPIQSLLLQTANQDKGKNVNKIDEIKKKHEESQRRLRKLSALRQKKTEELKRKYDEKTLKVRDARLKMEEEKKNRLVVTKKLGSKMDTVKKNKEYGNNTQEDDNGNSKCIKENAKKKKKLKKEKADHQVAEDTNALNSTIILSNGTSLSGKDDRDHACSIGASVENKGNDTTVICLNVQKNNILKEQSSSSQNKGSGFSNTMQKNKMQVGKMNEPKKQNSGSLCATKKLLESYDMTPPVRESSYCSYDISEIKSDEEEEEEEDDDDDNKTPRKPFPSWSHGIRLKNALLHLYHNSPDLDLVFGKTIDVPDLTQLLGMKKQRYVKRTSSAVWNERLETSQA